MNSLIASLASVVLSVAAASGAPLEVNPPELRGAVSQPQVALAADGRVHVVFGSDGAIFHTSSADGRAFSPPVKVGRLEKLALGMRRGPRIAVSGARLVITAISHQDGDVHCWNSPDAGRTWTEGALLNPERGSAREGLHALAGDGRGTLAVAWLDVGTGGKGVCSRVSHDGGATWGSAVTVYQSPDGHVCECCMPNVAVSPAGEILVMWRNWLGGARDFYLATSRDGGTTFSAAAKLGTGTWKLQACPMDGGGLAAAGPGGWLAVWRRERAIYLSTPETAERQLSPNAVQPLAGFIGQSPLLLWESGGALMIQRGELPATRLADKAAWASLATGTESAAIVWESGSGKDRKILYERVP